MTKQKITSADFAKNAELQSHSIKSEAVARALDEQAAALAHPKRFELLRLASKGRHSIADLAIASSRIPN